MLTLGVEAIQGSQRVAEVIKTKNDDRISRCWLNNFIHVVVVVVVSAGHRPGMQH